MSRQPGQFTVRYGSSPIQLAPPSRFSDLTLVAPQGLSPTFTSMQSAGFVSPPPRLASSPTAAPTAVQRNSYSPSSSFPRRLSSTPTVGRSPSDLRAPKAPTALSPLSPKERTVQGSPSHTASSPTTARVAQQPFFPVESRPTPTFPMARAVQRSSSASPTMASLPSSPPDHWWDRLMAQEAISPPPGGGRSSPAVPHQRSTTPLMPQSARMRIATPRSPMAPWGGALDCSPRNMSNESFSASEDSPLVQHPEGLSSNCAPAGAGSDPPEPSIAASARTARTSPPPTARMSPPPAARRSPPPTVRRSPVLTSRKSPSRAARRSTAEAQLVVADDTLHVACPHCRGAFGMGAAAPLVLLCGHSMCRSCCVSAANNDQVRCVACGAATALNGQGADTLQTNYAVRGIHAVALHGIGRQNTVDFLEDIGASCLVCLEVYSDVVVPNVLSCGHSICQTCCTRKLDACPLCNAAMQGVCTNKVLLKALEALVAVKRHGLDADVVPAQ
eukprot:GGOE01009297.1.p1 GENE.GGOE01009297.1~~GGOE01009297.1.p1  ORF type:complete len:513 (+),score=103.52 GGOE01009297.1:34-1539(+)